MEAKNNKSHSEDYFISYRDHWWNRDFLDLMAQRWELQKYSTLLDVGCGICHWSKILIPYLKNGAKVFAIDSDEKSAQGSNELHKYFADFDAEITFKTGNAHELEFDDDSFDVVTCQTVLIHLENPQKAVREMYRVVKPGGKVICAEPNNSAPSLIMDSISRFRTIEEILEAVKYSILYEKGKILSAQGNNSIGDFVPEMFSKAGLKNIKVFLSDKAMPLLPPYQSIEQQAEIDGILEWKKTNSAVFDKQIAKRYFEALGDEYLQFFEEYWENIVKQWNEIIEAISEKRFYSSGASLMYLVSGEK
ncbi:MAG TPA: methyltransferase domain-containing protein [Pyrinomonadaceae bacterium]|nr:methyltransferase domain-containing protein [Pyrinomonadaceae bacterium]